jgi:hypothetical protein
MTQHIIELRNSHAGQVGDIFDVRNLMVYDPSLLPLGTNIVEDRIPLIISHSAVLPARRKEDILQTSMAKGRWNSRS